MTEACELTDLSTSDHDDDSDSAIVAGDGEMTLRKSLKRKAR